MSDEETRTASGTAASLYYRTPAFVWILAGGVLFILLAQIVITVPPTPRALIGISTLVGGVVGGALIVLTCRVVGREDGLRVRNLATVTFVPWGDIVDLSDRGALRVTLRNGKNVSMIATSPSPLEAIRGYPRNVRLAAYIRQHQGASAGGQTRVRPNWFGAALLAGSLLFCIGFPILHGQLVGR